MTITPAPEGCARTVLYLRCYPYDSWQMDTHRRALEDLAGRLGLGTTRLYLDNGASSSALRPQLRMLLAKASMGEVATVLVPGRWVFSLDGRTADAVVDFLRSVGVAVVELPQHAVRGERRLVA